MSESGTSERAPLRVGILLDGWQQPHWAERLFQTLTEMPCVEIALVVLHDDSNLPDAGRHLRDRILRSRNRIVHMAYQKLDDRLFGRDEDAFAPRNVQPLLDGVPVITVRPERTKFSDRFEETDIMAVRDHKIDVFLRHGFRILRGEILNVAKYGLWSFHHGDNRVNRGGPPGTWEVFEGESMTGATLQVLTETLDGGRVLGRVQVPTDSRSIRRNCNNLYWRALHLVPRTLRRLFTEGEAALDDEPAQFETYDRRLYRWPTNAQSLLGVAGLIGRYLKDKLSQAIYLPQWQLAFLLSERAPAPYRFRSIVPPADRFWADPFPVEHNGSYFIFIEEFLFKIQRGRIAVIEMDAKGKWSAPRPVLELDTHLSYPFVFQWQDDFYMVPENAESGSVDLYKCTAFPDHWQKVATLLDGCSAVDTTLAEIDGHWWMWTTLREPGTSTYDETHLYRSDSPMGPFEPCRVGPVLNSPDVSRCGGRVFRHGAHWVRTAQDCADLYGRAILFRRIDRLSGKDYAETEIGRIEPNWDPDIIGTHTYNRAGKLQVIDLLRLRSRL